MKDKIKNNPEEPQVLQLIQEIKDGTVPAKAITKDSRLEIVELMIFQGQDAASIAQFLRVSNRTIGRDLIEIRQKNAISPSPNLVKVMAGEFLSLTQQRVSHLMRLARSKEGSLGEKVNAEYLAHRVHTEALQRLQSLGYLPTQPQAFVGSFFHNMDGVDLSKAIENLENEVLDIERIEEINDDPDPDIQNNLKRTKKYIQNLKNLKQEGGEDENLK